MAKYRVKLTGYRGIYVRKLRTTLKDKKPDIAYDTKYKGPDGKYHWHCLGVRSEGMDPEKAVEAKINFLKSFETGEAIKKEIKVYTLSQIFDMMIATLTAQGKARPQDYKTVWDRHLKNTFQNMIIPQIDHAVLNSFYTNLLKKKSVHSKKPLSSQTINHILNLLRKLIYWAIDNDLYQGINPLRSFMKKMEITKYDNKKMAFFDKDSPDETKRLLESLKQKSPVVHDMAYLSLNAGLRLGEVLKLRVENVHVADKQLHVVWTKGKQYFHRFVPINDDLLDILKERCEGKEANDYVFTSDRGKNFTSLSKTFQRTIIDLKLNKPETDSRYRKSFHTLRHTYASKLVENGVDLYIVKELLGHSSIKLTERYSHLKDSAKREAVQTLNGN